jgi:midasin
MCFSTVLHSSCTQVLIDLMHQTVFATGDARKTTQIAQTLPKKPEDADCWVAFQNYMWVPTGGAAVLEDAKFIITPTIAFQLRNLARVIVAANYPVLLQGPTSAGKTSMVKYMAGCTGNKYVRINNHAHTDVAEYLGTYLTNAAGKLVFQEGVLVQAVRNGHWLLLDELNLAPSEVLEVLNRLLDDNRELFIPDTQELIKPHPRFMLFATQNPAGLYGGRKVLSRAFRNRFLELHVGEIPESELEEILHKRCFPRPI